MRKYAFISVLICLMLALLNTFEASVEKQTMVKALNLATGAVDEIPALGSEKLTIRVLPVRGAAAYAEFPDGGNMLMDTGKKTDSRKLVRLVKEVITAGGEKYSIVDFFGWKPRIDWVLLTGQGAERSGGVDRVLSKFKVRKFVTYSGMDLEKIVEDTNLDLAVRRFADRLMKLGVDRMKLAPGEEFDLEQVVSSVKLVALGTQDGINIRITYGNFSMLLLPETDSQAQLDSLKKYAGPLKSTVMYAPFETDPSIAALVSPKYTVKQLEDVTFMTDGKYLQTVPAEYIVK